MYELSDAVSNLHYDNGSEKMPVSFYEELVRIPEDDSVEDLRYKELDNVVMDPSMVLQAYDDTTWEITFDVADNRVYNALDDLYGPELAFHWVENDTESEVRGTFKDSVEPNEVFESLAELEDVDFYYPDHMMTCLNGKYKELKRDFRSNDLDYEVREFSECKTDINQVRGELITGIKEVAEELPVMSNYGVFEGYSNSNFSNKNVDEDDLIEREAQNLDGMTAISTFDAGFIERDVLGLPPHLINVLWGE